jgi:hypothetical protein
MQEQEGISPGTFHFGVNWLPTTGGEKQLAVMRQLIHQLLGMEPSVFPLPVVSPKGDKALIWSDALWDTLENVAMNPGRAQVIARNTCSLAAGLLGQLDQDLRDRLAVMTAKDAELDRIRERIAEIQALEVQAGKAIDAAEAEMAATISLLCRDTRDALWRSIDDAIEEANRFMDASSCSAYVKNHLTPLYIEQGAQSLKRRLWERAEVLGEELDKLQADLDEIELPQIVIEGPQFASMRDYLARKTVKKSSEEAFKGYLGQLGGAAGPKAGFVNLAKKAVSKAGKLVGKRFSREFYNQMGATLRRLGLNAGLAVAAIGAIAIEIAAYLYQVWRWKGQLRGMMQRALGLPPVDEPIEDKLLNIFKKHRRPALEEMAENTREGLAEAMTKTREMIGYNYGRRASGLEQALAERRSMFGIDPAPLEEAATQLTVLAEQMTQWQGGFTHEQFV